jgi:hypothetical protein
VRWVIGYSTYFSGSFGLDKPLTKDHKAYLKAFSMTRRMKRNPVVTEKMLDPVRLAVGLPIGEESCYFVGGRGMCGQDRTDDILDYNVPPSDQPGLWCHWVPSEDGLSIEHDGGEKFYNYEEWIEYLIEHFLKPWGYVVTGSVEWIGEDDEDRGTLWVRKNVVKAVAAKIIHEEPDWGDGDPDDPAAVAEPDPAPNPIDSLVDLIAGDE